MALTYFTDSVVEAVNGIRMELCIFVIAFLAHLVLFGRHRILRRPVGGKEEPPFTFAPKQEPKAKRLGDEDAAKVHGAQLSAFLRDRVQGLRGQAVSAALADVLQACGRAASPELLSEVRQLVSEHGMALDARLGEAVLKGYYANRLTDEFEQILSQLDANGHGKTLGVAIQALKGALRRTDLSAAYDRLPAIAAGSSGSEMPTASAAMRSLVQWLIRTSIQQDVLTKTLTELQRNGFFSELFDAVLAECVSHSPAALEQAESFGRKEGIVFNDATYAMLFKGAAEEAQAHKLLSEVAEAGSLEKHVLIAAATWASDRKSTSFGAALLEKLPNSSPPEVAGKLLPLFDAECSKVLELYERHFSTVDLSSDSVAERVVAEACLKLKRHDVLTAMLDKCKDSTKRVSLVKHFGEEKRLQQAIDVFRACADKAPCLYNTVIDVCIDCESPDKAKEIMEEARAAGAADIVTYNTMIKLHLLSGSHTDAQQTMELLKVAGLQPNCVTFNELMDAVIKSKPESAWSLLDDMKVLGVKPNHITCSILLKSIKAKSTGNRVEKILDILNSMDDPMDEVLLSSVVEACIRVGRTDLLVPYLKNQKSMKKVQIRGPHTYGSIIRAYGFVSDISGAWDTWKEMRKLKILPSAITLGCMVEALVTNGDPEAGYELIQEMLQHDECKHLVNAVIYCSVVKGFSHLKKFNRVWAVYEEMIAKPQEVQFSIVTFNTLVDACARSGDMNRVPGLLERMVKQGIEPNLITYSAILKGYCQENRLDEAFKLVEDMIETTSFKPDEIMYNTLLDGCARQGLYDRGMKVLKEMESVGVNPSNFTLSVLVKLAGRARQLEKAFQLCDDLSRKYQFRLNIHVFDNLIQACIQQRDVHRAISVLARAVYERVRPDARTYTLLLRACIQSGLSEDAAALLRGALGLRGGHTAVAGVPSNMLQPQGGLRSDLISEVVEGIAKAPCSNEPLAVYLFKELRSKQGIKIDPRLQMRLTTQHMGQPQRKSNMQ